MTALITFDAKTQKLVARDDYGAPCGEVDGEPITAKTDSWDVARAFDFPATIAAVDHDVDAILVSFA